ncbi:DUF2189 domain-containing protein [Aestuariivirga sp.]|uniref:DUF2189 domain-containing protein n=1 Tax=Aestuariivirga sp. TaxID=2650926 RepID=UPI0039E40DDE
MSGGTDTIERPQPKAPQIVKITVSDVFRAMASGLRDMQGAPAKSLAFGLLYAAFGWLILFLMIRMEWGSYAYPFATGFALVAPIAAAGLYDISRRLEKGQTVTWGGLLSCLFGPGSSQVRIMTVVSTFAYIIWLDIAAAIYVAFWGMQNIRFDTLFTNVLMSVRGLLFLAIGNAIGAALAVTVFSIMVVSLPIIYDRQVDFVTAMITSVKAVLKNPKPMLLWCAIIGFLLFLSLVSLFAGLIVVFPLLGHTTWHIYRKVVAPPA